ncbi:CapA family protein [Arthrobacter tecti]
MDRRSFRGGAAALAMLLALSACVGADQVPAGSTDESAPTASTRTLQSPPDPSPSIPAESQGSGGTPVPSGPACPAAACTSVVVSGDLLLHEALWEQARADGGGSLDFGELLAAQEEYVAPADLAVCHQETPLAEPGGPFSGFPAFNVPPQITDAVVEVGYDACTTASNHTIDAGTAGLNRTLNTLDRAGLEHTGSYRSPDAVEPLIVDAGDARIAVITGTYALNGLVPEFPWQVDLLDPAAMIEKARQARAAGADLVLAAVHAGDEYADYANAQQQQVAHALVDSGEFDLIYGHHSHSVLPIEKYNGVWIVYGLGNTLAAHVTPDIRNTEGILARADFQQNDDGVWHVEELRWLPATWNGPGHRWCPVAADQLEQMAAEGTACVSAAEDVASRERTKATVESMGAAEDGAGEWVLQQP